MSAKRYTCLQLTSQMVRLVELSWQDGNFKQIRQDCRTLNDAVNNPLQDAALVETINDLLKGRKRKLVVSISSNEVLLKWIKLSQALPEASLEKQHLAIETMLAAENHIPVPLDEAAYDFHLCSPVSLLMGWMRQRALPSLTRALKQTQIELVHLTPQPVLLANRLIELSGAGERVCGIYINGYQCDLAVVEGKEIYGGRSFEIQQDGQAHSLWESIQQTVDNCPNPNGTSLTRLFMFQAGDSALSVPDGLFDCKGQAATFDWAEMLVGSMERSAGIGLNLLSPLRTKIDTEQRKQTKQRLWRMIPIAMALLLVAVNMWLFYKGESRQKRIDLLRSDHASAQRLQTKIESLKNEHRTITEALGQLTWGGVKFPPLAERLVQVAQCIPKAVQVTEIQTLPPPRNSKQHFDARQTLRLIGLAKKQPDIDAFRAALLMQSVFSAVRQVKTEQTLIKGERRLEFTLLLESVKGGPS